MYLYLGHGQPICSCWSLESDGHDLLAFVLDSCYSVCAGRAQVHIPEKESDGSGYLLHASVCHKVWLHLGQVLKSGRQRPTLSAGTWIGPNSISEAGVPNKGLECPLP